jgi:AraC-like DNA-binding protein
LRDRLLEPAFDPATVATAFGLSQHGLHRLFAEAGTSFSGWVRDERLRRAERALTCPSFATESIAQIAHRFGFCDAAHFSNVLKSQYGRPPAVYRSAATEFNEGGPFVFPSHAEQAA